MKLAAIVCALATAAAGLSALETPLTLSSGNGKVVVIDPSLGAISSYEVTQSKSDRLGIGGKPGGNFVADAEFLLKRCRDERDGVPFQELRIGSESVGQFGASKPAYGSIFDKGSPLLPDKPTRKEAAAGKAALTVRALKSEDAFWKANPSFDGTVRAALSSSGQYLAIALPSLHALMIYQLDSDVATLVAWRNYGPELFVPVGYNTDPDPGSLLSRLPAEKQKQAKATLGLDDDAKSDNGAAPPPVQADEPPTPKSEVWIGPGMQDSFVLVDLPSQRAMLYQMRGKELTLTSVRNLAIDLVLPGLVGGAIQSNPAGEKLFDVFYRSRKKQLDQFGMDTDIDSLTALVGQSQAKAGKASEFEATVNTAGVAFLNFCKSRVFLSLNTQGGARLQLTAARDYTLDTAISLLDEEINNRVQARQLLADVKQLGGKPKAALLTLRLCLTLDPRLHKDAEKAVKSLFKGEQQAEAQALIDEAVKKSDELAKQAEERKKAAEERKKAREALK